MVLKRKYLYGVLMLLGAMVLSLSFSSCSKDDDEKEPMAPGSYAIVQAGFKGETKKYTAKENLYSNFHGDLQMPCLDAVQLLEGGEVKFTGYDFGGLKFTNGMSDEKVSIWIDPSTKEALDQPNEAMLQNAGAIALMLGGWELTVKNGGEELEFDFSFEAMQTAVEKGLAEIGNDALKANVQKAIAQLKAGKKAMAGMGKSQFAAIYRKGATPPAPASEEEVKPIAPTDAQVYYKLTKAGVAGSPSTYESSMVYQNNHGKLHMPCADRIYLCGGNVVKFDGRYDFGDLKFTYEVAGSNIVIKIDDATKDALQNPTDAMKENAGFIALCLTNGYKLYGDENERSFFFSLAGMKGDFETAKGKVDNIEVKAKISEGIAELARAIDKMGAVMAGKQFVSQYEKQSE